jgi:hypothetical protein
MPSGIRAKTPTLDNMYIYVYVYRERDRSGKVYSVPESHKINVYMNVEVILHPFSRPLYYVDLSDGGRAPSTY